MFGLFGASVEGQFFSANLKHPFGKAKATETRQPSQAAPQQEREALCWGRVVALW